MSDVLGAPLAAPEPCTEKVPIEEEEKIGCVDLNSPSWGLGLRAKRLLGYDFECGLEVCHNGHTPTRKPRYHVFLKCLDILWHAFPEPAKSCIPLWLPILHKAHPALLPQNTQEAWRDASNSLNALSMLRSLLASKRISR
jgi:hypothetical protein